MTLKDIHLKLKYRSSLDIIHEDFYLPCLRESYRYDRAVGYFTSSSLSLLSKGLEVFLSNNGRIRIIANPHLNLDDIEAINLGYKAREDVVTEALLRELEGNLSDNLTLLSLLIYREQLEIKIAYPESNGIYHEKFGIFTDYEGNKISFSGSANETIGGLKENFEKIDVYSTKNDQMRIDDMVTDFEDLWNNNTPTLKIIAIPEIVKEQLYESTGLTKINKKDSSGVLEVRKYQEEAIAAVIENNWHGILEMATGTGKTYTSLLIAKEFYRKNNKIFLVVIVPFKHLLDQWFKNIEEVGFNNILICSSDNKNWRNSLRSNLRDFNSGIITEQIVITTYDTASSAQFNQYMSAIRKYDFLIADECHYFGQNRMKNNRFENFDAKVGLSATPERWFDEEGSEYISDFFKGTVYKYDLQKAIENGYLTEYQYEPIVTDLTEFELEEYEDYTRRIAPLISMENRNKIQEEQLQLLQIQRSRIVKGSQNKVEKLLNILSRFDVDNVSHVLVYCAEGQVDTITQGINRLGYKVHRFDHRVSNKDRQVILDAFDQGIIQILVAVNCLDEGVDVPATRTAYFLSSTSNPRQFIQRRGRILRKTETKKRANIYDFVTIPNEAKDSTFEVIVSKEIPRIVEFSDHAMNKYSSTEDLKPHLIRNNVDLSYLLEKNYY
ncbi:DEAD/DEAH box helicase family protein [Aerococcus urinaeequi]|uniref:DEAD/DEAH box helicase family protein n=1 Tax=Aerococcus urinaeequi TaxID=51665 RepID=UPI003D6C3510